jgi:hypothetical protein
MPPPHAQQHYYPTYPTLVRPISGVASSHGIVPSSYESARVHGAGVYSTLVGAPTALNPENRIQELKTTTVGYEEEKDQVIEGGLEDNAEEVQI